MARPAQLELFKFALYVFFPIATMLHFGDPDWYDRHVGPIRDRFTKADLPQIEQPQTPEELKAELERLRGERLARKADRENNPSPAFTPVRDEVVVASGNKWV